MTVPVNLTARHYAEQAVLAAAVAERKASAAWTDLDDDAGLAAWSRANDELTAASNAYYAAVQADQRVPDPVAERKAMAAWTDLVDCPGGAYVIVPDIDPADRYDSGYVASPAVADGRAADEFYGKEA